MRHKVWVESRLASKVPLDFFSYIEVPESSWAMVCRHCCWPLWLKILPPNNCFWVRLKWALCWQICLYCWARAPVPMGTPSLFLGDEYGLVLLSLFLPSIIIFSRYSLIWFPRKSTVLATEIEAICIVIFTLEYSLRLLGCNRAAGHGHVETCWNTAPCFGALREFLALLIWWYRQQAIRIDVSKNCGRAQRHNFMFFLLQLKVKWSLLGFQCFWPF